MALCRQPTYDMFFVRHNIIKAGLDIGQSQAQFNVIAVACAACADWTSPKWPGGRRRCARLEPGQCRPHCHASACLSVKVHDEVNHKGFSAVNLGIWACRSMAVGPHCLGSTCGRRAAAARRTGDVPVRMQRTPQAFCDGALS